MKVNVMKGKISKAEQKMAMSFASGGGGGNRSKRTSGGGGGGIGAGGRWYIIDDPANEATMKENYEAKLKHMKEERDGFLIMWHEAMLGRAELEKEQELLRKGHQQMVESMTEENRKLREKIAKLEVHVSGLEEALKLIGTTNVKENEDG